jgi:hypothetical protein
MIDFGIQSFSLPHIPSHFADTFLEVNFMSKDSQIDPKAVRDKKSKGGPTAAESALDGESRNSKKQSGNHYKPGDD